MIFVRKGTDRGRSKYEWLDSFHTFSFADYYDPGYMNFGPLRVINEDTVQAGKGFGKHPHDNMEIISYVIEGELAHQDSLGTGSVIKRGEIQKMSAGTGVEHSEFNHSNSQSLHFLQIWIIPDKQNLKPSYHQKSIPKIKDELILLGSNNADDSLITINQDIKLFVAYLSAHKRLQYIVEEKRGVWIQLVKGEIKINEQLISAGDGVAVFDEKSITIESASEAELLLFDLKFVIE